jgi:tetratricopeptide (TPR) repeat protein
MERALGHFEEALRLDPRNLDYLWSLFEYYEKFTRLEKMALIMKRILELDPYNDTAKAKLILIQEELEEETPVIETKNDEKEA